MTTIKDVIESARTELQSAQTHLRNCTKWPQSPRNANGYLEAGRDANDSMVLSAQYAFLDDAIKELNEALRLIG